MSSARYVVGDVFEEMAKMPDNSVDALICSPPFLALRSYLPSDHPSKHLEIGSEPTPAAFLSTLLALTREWRRILTPTGSLCVELGDTYAGSGGAGGDYGENGLRDGQPAYKGSAARKESRVTLPDGRTIQSAGISNGQVRKGAGWPLDKSLCLIPSLFAGSLAYGRNLLDPDDQLEPWRVRNLIVWHRPNPPVGALGDKVRPSTSYVTVACTAKDRWFDLDSERGPISPNTHARLPKGGKPRINTGKNAPGDYRPDGFGSHVYVKETDPENGAPPLDCWLDDAPDADVWTIPTAPFSGAHYATFPPALPRRLINLMCPRQVCTVCGEPRRRIVSEPEYVEGPNYRGLGRNKPTAGNHDTMPLQGSVIRTTQTLGWSDCGHSGYGPGACGYVDNYRRGIVFDPFAGSGTTLQAASELGRDSIGIDLDRRNLELARQRLGMFLVEDDEVVA